MMALELVKTWHLKQIERRANSEKNNRSRAEVEKNTLKISRFKAVPARSSEIRMNVQKRPLNMVEHIRGAMYYVIGASPLIFQAV